MPASSELAANPAGLKRRLFDNFTDVLQVPVGYVTEAIAVHKVGGEGSDADIDQTVAQLTPPIAVVNLIDALSNVPQRHQLDVNNLGDLLQRVEDGNEAIATDAVRHVQV